MAYADAQAVAVDQTSQILAMVGPHGIYAMLCTIIFVRFVASTAWYSKGTLMLVTMAVAASIGGLMVFFTFEDATVKQVVGGSFMTMIGSPLMYELLKFGCRFGMSATKNTAFFEFFHAVFWFLSPKPAGITEKDKATGAKRKVEIPPHEGLTDATQWIRMDRQGNVTRTVPEYKAPADTPTEFVHPEDRAGENFKK
tara:strand:- start:3830 stop:4420 length:591 start_codon:yes stop_codon:yes gene_type:complete